MKKLGFTLSELLITLGIIGVISALTLPTLISDTTSAQIGPKLAKAVAAFEQANQAMLSAKLSDSITDARLDDGVEYSENITKYFKATATDQRPIGTSLTSKDGFRYNLQFDNVPFDTSLPAHQQMIGRVRIQIDLKNQIAGTNYFGFSLWNDGSLIPQGAIGWDGTSDSNDGGAMHWKTLCPKAENGSVTDGFACAGHIFENNLKVLYK